MYQHFLIHSSTDGHLDYFHVRDTVNSAAMNYNHDSLKDKQEDTVYNEIWMSTLRYSGLT